MADTGGIRAGSAYIEASLKDNWSQPLAAMEKRLNKLGDAITSLGKKTFAIGAAITAPLLVAAQRFASMGDEINKASQRTGVGVEALSGLKYAAEASGIAFEDLETSIKRMQRAVFQAEIGNKTITKSFEGIGLSISTLKGLTPDEQFLKIAQSLSNVSDGTARAAIAMEIFGKSGTNILPMIANGAEGIRKMTDHANALGIVIGKTDAEAATRFNVVLKDMWKQLQAITFQAGAAVAQALQPFADGTTHVLAGLIKWVKENRAVVISILAVGVGIAATGAGLITLGLAIKSVATVMSGIGTVFSLLGTVIGLMLNPIVLVGAGIVWLASHFEVGSKFGGKALDYLGAKFKELSDTAKTVVGGIADALVAGDLLLAAKILWTGLKLAWTEGIKELNIGWINWKASFLEVGASAFYGIKEAAVTAWYGMKIALIETLTFFRKAWHDFSSWRMNAIEDETDFFVRAWITAREKVHAITKQQAQFEREAEVDQHNQANKNLADTQKKDSQQIEIDRKYSRDVASKGFRDDIAKIHGDKESLLEGINSLASEEKSDLERKIVDLKQQLTDLRNRAGQEKGNKSELPEPFLDRSKLASLDDVINERRDIVAKASAIFNPAAIQSVQQSTQLETRIANATERTAKGVEKLVNKGGLTFGK